MKRKKKFAPVVSKVKIKSSSLNSLKNKKSHLLKNDKFTQVFKGEAGNSNSIFNSEKGVVKNTIVSKSDTQLQKSDSIITKTSLNAIYEEVNKIQSCNLVSTSISSIPELQNAENLSSTLLKNFRIESLPNETAHLGNHESNSSFSLNENDRSQTESCETNIQTNLNCNYNDSNQHQLHYQENDYSERNNINTLKINLPNSFKSNSFSGHYSSNSTYPSFLSSNPFPENIYYSHTHGVSSFFNQSLPYYQPTFTDMLNSNSEPSPLDIMNAGLYFYDNQFPYHNNQPSFYNYNYPHINNSQCLNLAASSKIAKKRKKVDINKKEAEYRFFNILEQMKRNNSNKWPDTNKDELTLLNYLYINPPEENGKELGLKKKENDSKNKNVKSPEKPLENKVVKPTSLSAPRLELDCSGNIVVVEERFECPETELELTYQTEALPVNQNSFRVNPVSKRCKWSKAQTEKFYEALLCCGSNFSMMSDIMKSHTDKEIKRKYKNECKKNPKIIDELIRRHLNNEGDLRSFVPELETSKNENHTKSISKNFENTNTSL